MTCQSISCGQRLIYTSSPLQTAITPFGVLSGIFQRINTAERRIENIVEFDILPMRSPMSKTKVTIGAKFETIDYSRVRLKITDLGVKIGDLVSFGS